MVRFNSIIGRLCYLGIYVISNYSWPQQGKVYATCRMRWDSEAERSQTYFGHDLCWPHRLPLLTLSTGNHTARKTFFKSGRVQVKWNENGMLFLCMMLKSHYGETGMYLISATGNYDARVALPFLSRPDSRQTRARFTNLAAYEIHTILPRYNEGATGYLVSWSLFLSADCSVGHGAQDGAQHGACWRSWVPCQWLGAKR